MSDCADRGTLPATWLGDLELSPHLALRGQHEWCGANVSEARTIDGRHLWWADAMQGGRPLQLDGTGGHFTVGQLAAVRDLQALARPVTLLHHGRSYHVVIVGISGPEMWIDYADYKDSDPISATINLIEVLP